MQKFGTLASICVHPRSSAVAKFGRQLLALCALAGLLSGFLPPALGQTSTTGAIDGRVYEEGSTNGVAAALVTVVNQETGIKRSTRTDDQGRYFIATLPPGFYTISATREGYELGANSQAENFVIRLARLNVVQPPPITLRRVSSTSPPPTTPPPTTPSVSPQVDLPGEESDAEQLVNTTNAARGGSWIRRDLLALPLPGIRSFDQLAFLLPGVAPPPAAIGTNVGPGLGPGVGTSGQFSVNGLRSRSNNFTIDGSDNNDEDVGVRRQGFTTLVPQSIESVQEYQLTTLLAEPQFGRNMAAQANAVSRSGGNIFTGTIYGFLTDRRLRAHDAFDREGGPANFPIVRASDGQPVLVNGAPLQPANPVGGENPYTRAQYGFVLGGPIVQDKTQFFFAFERQDLNAARESHFAVPTVAERGLRTTTQGLTGDTGLNIPGVVQGQQVLLPAFPTSAAGDLFFSLFPFPNNPFGPYGANTYTEVLPASADGYLFSFRLDQQFNEDHNFAARYNFTDDDTTLPVTGEAIFSTLRALVRTQNLSLILNSTLSPRLTNQARFSYGRTSLNFREVRNASLLPSSFTGEPFLLNAPLLFNITLPGGPPRYSSLPGINTETAFGPNAVLSGTGPLGQVIISGYSPVGVDVFNFPQGRANNTFQYADTLIFNTGSHRLTAGADIRRNQLNSFLERNFRPLAVFSAAANLAEAGVVAGTANQLSLGAFLFGTDFAAAGLPTAFYQTQALVRDSTIGLRYWQNNFFLSDQMRLAPNFTLTLGARYELNSVPREVNDRIEDTFDSQVVQEFQAVERGAFGQSGLELFLAGRSKIFERDNNNIAPHIAIAWDPFEDGKTAIRAGYGIYYDQIPGAVISQSRNVFPSFITFNTAGLLRDFNCVQAGGPQTCQFVFANPQQLTAVPGTLNTFIGRPEQIVPTLVDLFRRTFTSSGTAFVLPAADLVTPYAQHWGLTLEREFGRDFLASAAYVGTRGVHLLRQATPNLGPNSIPIIVDAMVENLQPQFRGVQVQPLSSLDPVQLRPFIFLGSFTSIESDADSTYHGLQLQLNKRFSSGVQFTTSYTWSHAIDEVSDIFDLAGTRALPQNSFVREAERGDANFDVRQRFVYSFIWDLPGDVDSALLGGWQVASIGTFQTGQPYSVLFCCDANLDGNLTDRVSPGPTIAGQTGRNIFRAPGIANVDVAVDKSFRFGDRQRFQVRTEVFNLFNRAHYGIPVNQLFFGGFGISPLTQQSFVDTRLPARTVQFALKYNF